MTEPSTEATLPCTLTSRISPLANDPAAGRKLQTLTCPSCGASVRITDTFLMAYATDFHCIIAESDRERLAQACLHRNTPSDSLPGKIGDLIAHEGQCTCVALSQKVTAQILGH